MRLISFSYGDTFPRAGVLVGTAVIDLGNAAPLVFEHLQEMRWELLDILRGEPDEMGLDGAAEIVAAVLDQLGMLDDNDFEHPQDGNGSHDRGLSGAISIGGSEMVLPLASVRLLAPLPHPSSLRVFSAFEQHTTAIARYHGLHVSPAWYEFPAFSFGNHHTIYGSDTGIPLPRTRAFDYGLGLACVIGRAGQDIAEEHADAYIAGYTIVNHWAARDIQKEEFTNGVGAPKAHDFATSIGPWLVTPDELEQYELGDGRHNLTMVARVNEIERSRCNSRDMFYNFAQLIAYASRDVPLQPGDIIASGPADGGTLLTNASGQSNWLSLDDIVELEVTGLGILKNIVRH